MPYAYSRSGTFVGFVFGHPLQAGPIDPNAEQLHKKILWYVRPSGEEHDLRIVARPLGKNGPTVRETVTSEDGMFPDGIEVPAPGCWRLKLSWGAHSDHIDLMYHPPPNRPTAEDGR
ncbi:MAG: hypothetical protein ACREMZ_17135 [Gemmatimonadales bacterium]